MGAIYKLLLLIFVIVLSAAAYWLWNSYQVGAENSCSEGAPSSACSNYTSPDPLQLERRIHELINIERKNNGLSELAWNPQLASIARAHSLDMATRNYIAHESPESRDFSWRYAQAGFECKVQVGSVILLGAENLHQGSTYKNIWYRGGVEVGRDNFTPEQIASNAVSGWMNSPEHRENIVIPYWQTEGIGVAIRADGNVYVTQNFC